MSAQLPRTSASTCAASGRAVIRGRDASRRTPLESARAYASMLPGEAEMEGAWVRRWDAEAGGAGADWATCQRLLERAAAAADVACDGAVSVAASSTRVWGGCLFVLGGKLCLIWPPTCNSKTTTQPKTHARDAGGKFEEVRPVRSTGGAQFDRWGRSSWAGGYNTKINHHACIKIIKSLSLPGICATHDGLLRTPLTTIIARG
jgi:hypothetical protein